jgi:hypothetical protein
MEISLVDVAHTGRTTYICVSIVLCIFYVLFSFFFYCSAVQFFLTTSIIAKRNWQEKRVPSSSGSNGGRWKF